MCVVDGLDVVVHLSATKCNAYPKKKSKIYPQSLNPIALGLIHNSMNVEPHVHCQMIPRTVGSTHKKEFVEEIHWKHENNCIPITQVS